MGLPDISFDKNEDWLNFLFQNLMPFSILQSQGKVQVWFYCSIVLICFVSTMECTGGFGGRGGVIRHV